MATKAAPAKNKRNVQMPEEMEFERVGEPQISMYNFEKNPVLHCYNVRKDKLKHVVYKVQECETGKEFYLPAHAMLAELFGDKPNPSDVFKIEFMEKREYNDAKGKPQTYHVYETFKAK